MKTKHIKFWGGQLLEGIGVSLNCAAVFSFFQICRSDYSQGMGALVQEALALFPYYLFFSTAFVSLMLVVGYFQVYFSVLVSVNGTRKQVARGINVSLGLTAVAAILIAAVVWMLVPGDVAQSGLQILPLLAGIMLIMMAFFLVFGGVSVKWGKAGKIIMMVLCMVMGAIAGITVALNADIASLVMKLAKGHFLPVSVVGAVLYLAAGVFMERMTQKFEVRV